MKLNRAQRRQAQRDIKKAVKTGVGVTVSIKAWRVVRPDGTIKQSSEREVQE